MKYYENLRIHTFLLLHFIFHHLSYKKRNTIYHTKKTTGIQQVRIQLSIQR